MGIQPSARVVCCIQSIGKFGFFVETPMQVRCYLFLS